LPASDAFVNSNRWELILIVTVGSTPTRDRKKEIKPPWRPLILMKFPSRSTGDSSTSHDFRTSAMLGFSVGDV